MGTLALLAGLLMYSGLLHRGAGGQGSLQTVRAMLAGTLLANVGGAILLAGLAALRDRIAMRASGVALGLVLFALDERALIAYLPEPWHLVVAGVIGLAFVIVPWTIRTQ